MTTPALLTLPLLPHNRRYYAGWLPICLPIKLGLWCTWRQAHKKHIATSISGLFGIITSVAGFGVSPYRF